MRKFLRAAGIAAALLAGVPASALAADSIQVAELPGEVVQALQKRFRDAILLDAAREQGNGAMRYQVRLRHEGRQHEVDVSPDGSILKVAQPG